MRRLPKKAALAQAHSKLVEPMAFSLDKYLVNPHDPLQGLFQFSEIFLATGDLPKSEIGLRIVLVNVQGLGKFGLRGVQLIHP